MKKGFVAKIPGRSVADQEAALREHGIPARDIYVKGRNGEDLAAALRTFRGRPGELVLAADLRVFGERRKDILPATDLVEAAGVKLLDIHNKEDRLSKMLDRVLRKVAGNKRWENSRHTPGATGRKGGKVKGLKQAAKRDDIATEDVKRRMCRHPKLTWKDCEDILGGPPHSASTLRRLYGDL